VVVDDPRQPLSVGRKTRTIPAAIKRALAVRDRTCRFPGCDHRLYLDGHHIEHWADGGETKIYNLCYCVVFTMLMSMSMDIRSASAMTAFMEGAPDHSPLESRAAAFRGAARRSRWARLSTAPHSATATPRFLGGGSENQNGECCDGSGSAQPYCYTQIFGGGSENQNGECCDGSSSAQPCCYTQISWG
jgi:hypothetical protein